MRRRTHSFRKDAVLRVSGLVLLLMSGLIDLAYSDPLEERVKQKYAMVEKVVKRLKSAQVAHQSSGEYSVRLGVAETQLQKVKDLIDAGELAIADTGINELLKLLSRTSYKRKNPTVKRDVYENLLASVQSHWQAYQSILPDIDIEKQKEFEASVSEAVSLANTKNYMAATQVLKEIYERTINQLVSLRNNQTLIHSLDFASPEDEYQYELGRFKSYRLLLDLKLAEKANSMRLLAAIDVLLTQAESLRSHANVVQGEGDHQQAVELMEQSIALMVKALRMLDVMIP